ncbi:MAG: hypothetical protein AAB467_02890 [Patescibacteria group bacterium]
MIGNINLPPELTTTIGGETPDFVVISARKVPVKEAITRRVLGLGMIVMASLVLLAFLTPLLTGTEGTIEINNVSTKVGPGNWTPILLPVIIISIFLLLGIYMTISNILNIFGNGGYFVGLPTRLINFRNGHLESITWDQFSGNTKTDKDTLYLEKKTGSMAVKSGFGKHPPSRVVPDFLYLVNIPDVYEIGAICAQRIKENNSTPSQPISSVG